MTDIETLTNLITESKRYSGICPDTVSRVLGEELGRHKKTAAALKAAKSRLHQAAGMFFNAGDKALEAALERGDPFEAAALHMSGRERMENWREFYSEDAVDISGKDVLDIACGLNPLVLFGFGAKSVRGVDICLPSGAFLERFAKKRGWDFSFLPRDAVSCRSYPKADIALLLKLLPIIERERAGSAAQLLSCLECPEAAVSFPTLSVSGKGKGMRGTYSEWFARILPACFTVERELIVGNELLFIIKKDM